MTTIGLLWHSYISGNLGVSALSDANMTIIGEALEEAGVDGPVRFILFGPRGDDNFTAPAQVPDFEYVTVSRFSQAPAVRRKLAECDMVFDIGGGDSFSDIYGVKRLTKIAGLKFLVPQMGKRLVLSPQTMGPFSAGWARLVGGAALRGAHRVFARDAMSMDRARALMGPARAERLELTTDVAFALRRLDGWPEGFPALEQGRMHVGLNVSGLLYAGGYTGDNQFGLSLDYAALIDALIGELTARQDVTVWLVPHVYRLASVGMESDRGVCETLAERHPELRVAPLFYNAREAKTFLAGMNLVLAARMHAAIGAVSSGVACVPMSYSVKFQGLFESLGYRHTLDMKSATQDEALARCIAALDAVGPMGADAAAAAAAARDRLQPYRDFVARFVRDRQG